MASDHSLNVLFDLNRAWVITLVLENLNVTDGAKKFLLKRPKSKQIDDRSTIAKRKFSSWWFFSKETKKRPKCKWGQQ